MNAQQKLIRVAGIALLLLMALYPPWQLSFDAQEPDAKSSAPMGYHALWNPPTDEVPEEYSNSRYRINLVRLGIQFVSVLVLVNVGMLVVKKK